MTRFDEIAKKKVVRNGKVVRIIPPKPGFRIKDGRYVKITGSDKAKLHKAAKKAARSARSGKARRLLHQRKSNKIRKSHGLQMESIMTRAKSILRGLNCSPEFSHTYKLGTSTVLAFFKGKEQDKKFIVTRGKDLWLLYKNGARPEHILTFNKKAGEVYTDLPITDIKEK